MIPRLDISFPIKRQWQYWFGTEYKPRKNEMLLNHARSGIYLALRAQFPNGARVGVMAYNCHTVMNPVIQAGCEVVFLDVKNNLTIDETQLEKYKLEAIVVSNLFGIKNDIISIRKLYPNLFIIEDNAHGYGLKEDGDVVVYSINLGKYPALGEGGILVVKSEELRAKFEELYRGLPEYSAFQFWKLFATMKAKAYAHLPWVYAYFTLRWKKHRKQDSGEPEKIEIKKMCKGVSRIYNAWLQEHNGQVSPKLFMDIIRTDNPTKFIEECRKQGVESDVHFKNWPLWAAHYGYERGMCPMAEQLLDEVVMVPNYYKK